MTFCRTVVIGYQYGKHSSNLPTKILILKTLAACKKKSNSLQEPHASLCHGNSRHSKCDKEMILRKMVPTKSVQMSTSLQSWLTCSSSRAKWCFRSIQLYFPQYLGNRLWTVSVKLDALWPRRWVKRNPQTQGRNFKQSVLFWIMSRPQAALSYLFTRQPCG